MVSSGAKVAVFGTLIANAVDATAILQADAGVLAPAGYYRAGAALSE